MFYVTRLQALRAASIRIYREVALRAANECCMQILQGALRAVLEYMQEVVKSSQFMLHADTTRCPESSQY